jgi:hypothetical protein
MKSLLFRTPSATPFVDPEVCSPCRTETKVTFRKFGRIYTMTVRDKVVVEDPYLVMVKAQAFAIGEGAEYSGTTPERPLKDFLIKTNVVI